MKKLDLLGKRFTKLEVLEEIRCRQNGKVRWKCKCDCGKIIETGGSGLVSGARKSCGCYSRELMASYRRIGYGEAAFNRLLNTYQASARRRNYSFELSKEEFKQLTEQNCTYCGIKPENQYKTVDNYGTCTYNGIDRRNNSLGYLVENCVPCCKRCNIMKGTMNHDEFIAHMKKILLHLGEIT